MQSVSAPVVPSVTASTRSPPPSNAASHVPLGNLSPASGAIQELQAQLTLLKQRHEMEAATARMLAQKQMKQQQGPAPSAMGQAPAVKREEQHRAAPAGAMKHESPDSNRSSDEDAPADGFISPREHFVTTSESTGGSNTPYSMPQSPYIPLNSDVLQARRAVLHQQQQQQQHFDPNHHHLQTPSSGFDSSESHSPGVFSSPSPNASIATVVGASSLRRSAVPAAASPASAAQHRPSPKSGAGSKSKSSCHQCKSSKPDDQLFFCTNRAKEGIRKRRCRKKYCRPCLKRCYPDSFPPNFPPGLEENASLSFLRGTHWECPSCSCKCICASCTRKSKVRAQQALADKQGGGAKGEHVAAADSGAMSIGSMSEGGQTPGRTPGSEDHMHMSNTHYRALPPMHLASPPSGNASASPSMLLSRNLQHLALNAGAGLNYSHLQTQMQQHLQTGSTSPTALHPAMLMSPMGPMSPNGGVHFNPYGSPVHMPLEGPFSPGGGMNGFQGGPRMMDAMSPGGMNAWNAWPPAARPMLPEGHSPGGTLGYTQSAPRPNEEMTSFMQRFAMQQQQQQQHQQHQQQQQQQQQQHAQTHFRSPTGHDEPVWHPSQGLPPAPMSSGGGIGQQSSPSFKYSKLSEAHRYSPALSRSTSTHESNVAEQSHMPEKPGMQRGSTTGNTSNASIHTSPRVPRRPMSARAESPPMLANMRLTSEDPSQTVPASASTSTNLSKQVSPALSHRSLLHLDGGSSRSSVSGGTDGGTPGSKKRKLPPGAVATEQSQGGHGLYDPSSASASASAAAGDEHHPSSESAPPLTHTDSQSSPAGLVREDHEVSTDSGDTDSVAVGRSRASSFQPMNPHDARQQQPHHSTHDPSSHARQSDPDAGTQRCSSDSMTPEQLTQYQESERKIQQMERELQELQRAQRELLANTMQMQSIQGQQDGQQRANAAMPNGLPRWQQQQQQQQQHSRFPPPPNVHSQLFSPYGPEDGLHLMSPSFPMGSSGGGIGAGTANHPVGGILYPFPDPSPQPSTSPESVVSRAVRQSPDVNLHGLSISLEGAAGQQQNLPPSDAVSMLTPGPGMGAAPLMPFDPMSPMPGASGQGGAGAFGAASLGSPLFMYGNYGNSMLSPVPPAAGFRVTPPNVSGAGLMSPLAGVGSNTPLGGLVGGVGVGHTSSGSMDLSSSMLSPSASGPAGREGLPEGSSQGGQQPQTQPAWMGWGEATTQETNNG